MLKKPFLSIEQIYESRHYDFKQTFHHLQILNNILATQLPDNLIKFCHIGAFDKKTVVLFVNNQSVLHMLNGQTNRILQEFYNHNYNFDNLLIKLRITNKNNTQLDEINEIEL
jgi:hypothetical protein